MSEPTPLSPHSLGSTEEQDQQAPRIGDRLRQARERRGISISGASATLKIREPILEAFEREDHTQLPPRVYALGLLRTYAAFLGLDPATVAAGWQSEPIPNGRYPLMAPTRPSSLPDRLLALRPSMIQSTRGILAFGGLGLAVLAISGFMLLQLLRFILPPSIAITYPVDAISNLPAGTLSFELKGTADANARIVISTSAGAQLTTGADESGLWRLIVPLGTGRTEVVAQATKPGTGAESSTSTERVFIVAVPDKIAPEIRVIQPSANLNIENSDVPISLVTNPNTEIGITATDTAGGVVNATVTSDAKGGAKSGVSLPAGRWTISFSITAADGSLGQATRTVDVSFTGVTVSVTGGTTPTWIRVWIDGQLDPSVGVSGKTIQPGTRFTFTGKTRVEIRGGDPSVLLFTLNGRTISGLNGGTGAETYAFLSTGKVQKSSRR